MKSTAVEKNHALDNAKAHLEDIIKMHTQTILAASIDEAEEIEEEARQDVLSVEIRSNCWQSVGTELTATQARLVLTVGGPGLQLVFDLDQNNQPSTDLELQYQDWFKPWTGYWPENQKDIEEAKQALVWFAGLFFYGE